MCGIVLTNRMRPYVLFVDDDESNLIVWETACCDQFAVLTANGAERALELLHTHEVGVVVADQRMPGMTGIELLERIRDEFPDTVRILITAYSDLGAAIDAINRGNVRRYLRKPCALSELRAELFGALELYELRSRARAMERRLLHTERVYSLGLVASGLGRELAGPASLVRESVGLARTEVRAIADRLGSPGQDPRTFLTKLVDLEEWLGRALLGIERIVDLARSLELKPDSSDFGAVDVGAVLRLSLRIVRGELRRGADVELDIRAVPLVRGTSAKLGQVVLNLLVNALEAVSALPLSERLITVRLTDDGSSVRLEVCDNGPQIAEAELPRTFDPLRLSTSGRGVGLGLAISKALVEEMGGVIRVAPRPGGGATFTVLLRKSEKIHAVAEDPAWPQTAT
jgi:two-component system, NtrC family, sensor kinase